MDTSPLQAAMMSAGVVSSIDEFIRAFMGRGAVKMTLLQVPETTSELERKKLKTWWDRVVRGIRTAWSAHIISGEIHPVILGEGLAEISDDNRLTHERKEDIGLAFGIPASKLFGSAANYATARQHEMDFYTSVIIPQALKIQKAFNRQVFALLGMHLKFLPETLSVFQKDEAERAKSLQMLVASGMKLSVATQVLGYALPVSVDYSDLDKEDEGIADEKSMKNVSDGYDTERRLYEEELTNHLVSVFISLSSRIAGNYFSSATEADWVEEGSSRASLERQLRAMALSTSRAKGIAETEVTRAFAHANRAAWLRSPSVENMEWETVRDERVCPICRPLQGKVVDLDGAFGGASFSIPPAHSRCRCWITPEVT